MINNSMGKKYYILLKTHNKTGLKYLCKHVTAHEHTCYSYLGSGVYWARHLAKHGEDISTEIIAVCNSANEAKETGLEYSNKWNIVESKEFANLIPEHGQGGAEAAKCRKTHAGWRGFRLFGDDNVSRRPEVRKKISEKLKGRKITWGDKISKSCKGRIPWNKGKPNPYAKTDHMNYDVTCPHCRKVGKLGAMTRWHFDNCKLRRYSSSP